MPQKALIPTVDISSFLADPSSPEAALAISQIRDACMSVGFFQITSHGISPALQESVFLAAKTFFALPQDVKNSYGGVQGRGYEVIGSQALDPSMAPDLKEGFFVGRDVPPSPPPYRNFEHPNIWPTPAIPDAQFKEPLLAYHAALCELAHHVLRLLARGLPALDQHVLSSFCREPVASVRLLHYPAHPESPDPRLVGAGAHTDFGAITLLLQDAGSGLQVLNQSDATWIDVPPQKGAYVVNVGDMLERWTAGRYKSNVHRVINSSGTDRYSVPFFFDGNLDFVVRPLDAESGGVTVEQHLRKKYEEVMSTQAARAIRFTHTSPQRAFRLLELTPEILELISSENAPTLYLKSPLDDPTTTGQDGNAYVNLCTPTKTFRIRQVQSSNSIHVIRPSDAQSQVVPLIAKRRDGQNDIGDEEMVSESVTAIAKCASTLEMHALNEGESLAEAKRTLSRMLPVFDSYTEKRDEDVDMGGVDNADRGTTKEGIFDDLPFAQFQCQTAWLELCAFIHNGHGFRPSAGAKLEVWRRVFEGCILHNIDLERQFLVGDVWKATLGEDSTLLSRGLFDAVVRRLAEAATGDAELKWSNMDKTVCIQWIGETYLEATAPVERRAIGRSEFLNAWKDLLPETWRDGASLSNLPENSYKYPDPVSICFVQESEREKLKSETKDAGNAAKAKNSRNWHERFKSQRK